MLGCDFVGGESVMRFEENCVNGILCQEMVKNMDKVLQWKGKN